jgi:3-oxoacyl-[acyl-carrier protein] reductase
MTVAPPESPLPRAGQYILVTGAGSGIGAAIAVALGVAGAAVGVHFHSNRAGPDQVAQRIAESGGRAVTLQADVSRPADVERLFSEFEERVGPLDGVVNNAGEWMDRSPIVDCPLDRWQRMFDVNTTSVFLCCQHAARRMMPRKRGAIVNIGSVAGHTGGGGGTVPYAAAKAAVHTLTRGLARELAPHGIRVNGVAPGMVATPMLDGRVDDAAKQRFSETIPIGRFASAEDIAPIVCMLLSDGAAYITGEIVDVNGGYLMR